MAIGRRSRDIIKNMGLCIGFEWKVEKNLASMGQLLPCHRLGIVTRGKGTRPEV